MLCLYSSSMCLSILVIYMVEHYITDGGFKPSCKDYPSNSSHPLRVPNPLVPSPECLPLCLGVTVEVA